MNKNHKFTRRSFLKTTIASLATLSIVPRHVLGGAGFTPPSEILTRAVIGTGGMGMGHVTGINTACKLLAVCDVDEKHLQTAIKNRHLGKWNVMFCDGHVREQATAELFNFNDDEVLRLRNKDHLPHRELFMLNPP